MKKIQLSDEEINIISDCIIAQINNNRNAINLVIDISSKLKIEENQKKLHELLIKLNSN